MFTISPNHIFRERKNTLNEPIPHLVDIYKQGKHAFKFIVDDEWRFAPDQPTVADIEGRINNFIDVSDFVQYTGDDNYLANQGHTYSVLVFVFERENSHSPRHIYKSPCQCSSSPSPHVTIALN
jgi:hypothetical protein